MITLRNKMVSGSTLLLWVLMTAISTLGCLLITSATYYFNYDCWIMYQHQPVGGSCALNYNQGMLFGVDIVCGLLLGTIFTCKLSKSACR